MLQIVILRFVPDGNNSQNVYCCLIITGVSEFQSYIVDYLIPNSQTEHVLQNVILQFASLHA